MELTYKQYELLYNMFSASIKQAMDSGIPIGKEYYEDIDCIRENLLNAMRNATLREVLQSYDFNQ